MHIVNARPSLKSRPVMRHLSGMQSALQKTLQCTAMIAVQWEHTPLQGLPATSVKATMQVGSGDALQSLHKGSCPQRQLLLLRNLPDVLEALRHHPAQEE